MFCKNSLIFLIVHPPHTTIYILEWTVRSGSVFWSSRKQTGAKRGRPRTRPERTTPKRPYKRSFNHTKAKIAERKAAAQAKRATKMANKRAPKINFPPHDDSKSIKENVAIQEAIKKARGRNRLPVVLGPFS